MVSRPPRSEQPPARGVTASERYPWAAYRMDRLARHTLRSFRFIRTARFTFKRLLSSRSRSAGGFGEDGRLVVALLPLSHPLLTLVHATTSRRATVPPASFRVFIRQIGWFWIIAAPALTILGLIIIPDMSPQDRWLIGPVIGLVVACFALLDWYARKLRGDFDVE